MRNPNHITNPKTARRYARHAAEVAVFNKQVEDMKAKGYTVMQTLKAGTNSSFSFSHNGVDSGLGFDSPAEAWNYIIKQQTPQQ